MGHPVHPVLAARSAGSRAVSNRLAADFAVPPGGHRRPRCSRACERDLYASCPTASRPAGHLILANRFPRANCGVKPRKTSVFRDLWLPGGDFPSFPTPLGSVENVVETVASF